MSYSKLKIYGNCDVNYMWSKRADLTNNEINTITNNGIYSPVWDGSTYALAIFKDDVSASSFTQNNTIVGYSIQRYNINADTLLDVVTTDDTVLRIQDYNVRNMSKYQYYIIPIFLVDNVKVFGSPIISSEIDSKWENWSVIGLTPTNIENEYTVDNNNIWTFGCNVRGGDITHELKKEVTDGNGTFPKIVNGKTSYIKGSVECLIGTVSNLYHYVDDDIYKINKWVEFCRSSQLKLLKDTKGNVVPCDIIDTSMNIGSSFYEKPTKITFNFVQLDDSDNLTVYGYGGDFV